MLNQVYNILDEAPENISEMASNPSPVFKLYNYIRQADVITFLHGRAVNDAHQDLVFKQVGVRPRQLTLSLLQKKLEDMGKFVTISNY